MELGDAVLWTSFVTGVLGAIAFFWQFVQVLSVRKQGRSKTLNKNVLRPWSEIQVRQAYGSEAAYRLLLTIPQEALPPDAAPHTGQDGLDVSRLPGLPKAEAFLRERYRATFALWRRVRLLAETYEGFRVHRRGILESRIRADLSQSYPMLRPVAWKDMALSTYVLDNVVSETEGLGNREAKDGDMLLRVTDQPTQSGDILYHEFSGGSYPMLRVRETDVISKQTIEKLLTDLVHDADVSSLSTKIVQTYGELGIAIEQFRSSLKEVAIDVDLTAS